MPHLQLLATGWTIGVAAAILCDLGGGGDAAAVGLRAVAVVLATLALVALAGGASRAGLLGLSMAVAAATSAPRPGASPQLFDGAPWSLLGRIDGTPRRDDRGLVVPLELEAAGERLPDRRASGRLQLRAPSPIEPIGPGDRVLVRARAGVADRRCNFGACDGAWRSSAAGVDGLAFVSQRAELVRADLAPRGLAARLWRLREAMRARIEARLPPADAALLGALVVGERGAIGEEEEARFRAAGVTHLLSVSGLHLAFAAGLLFAVARALLRRLAPAAGARRPRERWAAGLALPIVLAYALLTGAEVATLRAALVVGFAFVGVVAVRRVRGRDALCFAALALLVPRPASLIEPSFQLSFVAAWATLAVAGGAPRASSLGGRLLGRGAQLVRVSLAATIATAPITAWHFGQIAPAGVLTNLVAVPLTEAAIVPLGLCAALVDLAVPALGGPLLLVAGGLCAALRGFVAAVAAVTTTWTVAAPSLVLSCVSAIALLWLARSPTLRRTLGAAAIVAAVMAIEHGWQLVHPRLEIVFVDVGQGDAAIIRFPDGSTALVDGGPGAQAIAPALQRLGVRRLALVVLSHPHPDHAGGLVEVLRRFEVGELWTNGQPGTDPTVRALLAEAEARRVRLGTPRPIELGGVAVDVLHPLDASGAIAFDPLASENDNSLALRLRWAGRSILLPGDVEAEAERAIAASSPGTVDLLKVPHHGSRTSSTVALLDALRPRWAVASLAAGNRYRFPHPDVVARYRERGVVLLRTDRDGAVRARIHADGEVELECARGCRP